MRISDWSSDVCSSDLRGFSGKPKDSRGMDDVVRELHGQPTGNARAKTFAGAVTDVYEKLRLRFNAAGGDIGKLRGHGLVHRHDPIKVRQAGYAQWRTDILREIDTNAMRDPDTGGQIGRASCRERVCPDV